MLHGAFHHNGIVPCTLLPYISLPFAAEILQGKRIFILAVLHADGNCAAEHNFTSVYTRFRANVYQKVCGAHDLLVMLYHDHGISYVTKPLEHRDKPFRISRM